MQPCSKTGEYLVPIFPSLSPVSSQPLAFHSLCASLSHNPLYFSIPPGSPELSFRCQQREIWFPVYTEDSQKQKWEQSSVRKQYMAWVSSCADILQAATSGATALKVGVGRGPVVTVYESYVCVFSALIPGQPPVQPLAHHSCCGS